MFINYSMVGAKQMFQLGDEAFFIFPGKWNSTDFFYRYLLFCIVFSCGFLFKKFDLHRKSLLLLIEK